MLQCNQSLCLDLDIRYFGFNLDFTYFEFKDRVFLGGQIPGIPSAAYDQFDPE